MENATKALLIAAAVLISIVLVALGVNLLSSTQDTTEDAGEVADQIGSSTSSAVSTLGTGLGKLEEKDMITFTLMGEATYSCPRGYTVRQAINEGILDNWSLSERNFAIYNGEEGKKIIYSYGGDEEFVEGDHELIDGEEYYHLN